MHTVRIITALTLLAGPALAAVTPPPGYIYSTQLLANLTQGCVAAGPGGTFVGIGPAFTANAQAIVLARESGDLRLVAMGFNSIADCAYDAASDTLYVSDNADNADLGISTSFAGNTGAQSGDTVFAVPNASTASGLSAAALELLPADSVEFAAGLALAASGAVLVGNAAGSGGSVLEITPGPVAVPLVSGLNFVGGLAVRPASGDLYVAENLGLPLFDNQVRRYTAAGAPIAPVPFAGPSFAFGSTDLLFDGDDRLLASGNFGADVVAIDADTGSVSPFVSGLTFATGMALHPFTGRVEILSATFGGADEDKSLHRFTPVDRLTAGKGSPASECVHELYGIALVGNAAVCTDGAACDADGAVNDVCLFPVGFCLNVADADYPECALGEVTDVIVSAKPASAAIADTAARLTAGLPRSDSTCVFSDGLAVAVRVTPAGKKEGKATLKVRATTDDGRKDTDVFKLVCTPAP